MCTDYNLRTSESNIKVQCMAFGGELNPFIPLGYRSLSAAYNIEAVHNLNYSRYKMDKPKSRFA